MYIKKNAGFTLIELMVVISIIGVLSAIVLASMTAARNKGANAAVKADLNGVIKQAEIYFYAHSNAYGTAAPSNTDCGVAANQVGVFADTNISAALVAAKSAEGGTALYCTMPATGTAYAVAVPLKGGGYWCVDSTGIARSATAGGTAYTGTNGASPAAVTNATTYKCN